MQGYRVRYSNNVMCMIEHSIWSDQQVERSGRGERREGERRSEKGEARREERRR